MFSTIAIVIIALGCLVISISAYYEKKKDRTSFIMYLIFFFTLAIMATGNILGEFKTLKETSEDKVTVLRKENAQLKETNKWQQNEIKLLLDCLPQTPNVQNEKNRLFDEPDIIWRWGN